LKEKFDELGGFGSWDCESHPLTTVVVLIHKDQEVIHWQMRSKLGEIYEDGIYTADFYDDSDVISCSDLNLEKLDAILEDISAFRGPQIWYYANGSMKHCFDYSDYEVTDFELPLNEILGSVGSYWYSEIGFNDESDWDEEEDDVE
jgi:hypothetical protein